MEEIRKMKLPDDLHLLERFLMVDPVEFLHLISHLSEQHFPQAYAGISQESIKTLVTRAATSVQDADSIVSSSKTRSTATSQDSQLRMC